MTTSTRRALLAATAALLGSLTCLGAAAQGSATYPSQPLKLVVPYPAGGATDRLARLMGTELQKAWGQTVVVENKPGASGTIGNDMVAKAAPDGYTVLVAITAIVQAPALMPKLPYDVLKDLQPLAQIASSNSVFAVPPNTPANNLKDFIALVKAHPGQYNYGSYGVGTSAHIQGSLLNLQAGLDMAHIPYKGAAPLVQDLLGGQLKSAMVDMATAQPHLKSFKILAVTGPQRNKLLPDVPTFAELGYHSYEPLGWFAMFMPAGVPAPIAAKVATEANRVLRTPEIIAAIEAMGLAPGGMKTEDFARIVRSDAAVYAKIIKDTGIKLE